MPQMAKLQLPMRQYDAVLFDLDGTLLNTLEDLTRAVNHTLRLYGYPTLTADTVRSYVGNGVRNLIARALPGGKEDARMEEALAAFKQYYTTHCISRTQPYEGVLEALTALHEAGIKLAIVSNKNDEAVKTLSREFFGSLVHTAVGGQHGTPRKPAPDMPLLALDALDASPARALFVGDSDVDFATAQNIGMDCMLVSWGFRDADALSQLGARFFVTDPAEIPALILQAQEAGR